VLKTWLAESIRPDAPLPSETVAAELDEVWEKLISELSGAFMQSPHPLKELAVIAWDQARDLLELRLALLAKQFGPAPPPQKFLFFRKTQPTRNYSLVSAMAVLRQIYLAYATAYRMLPSGFWMLANMLFLRAVGAGTSGQITRLPQPLPPAAEVYRQLVVYSLANPHSLRTGFLPVATQLLDYFAPLARLLETAPAQEGARGLCVVALEGDHPPRSVARADPTFLGSAYLFVQLHDLTYEMQHCAESVARGGVLPVSLSGNAMEVTRRETIEVIGAALRAFAGIAARAIPRVPASGPIDVISGFYNAWTTLTAPENELPSTALSVGNVVNQTVTGVAFRVSKQSELAVRVGEIALFRRRGQPIWRIGVVRWIEVDAVVDDVLIGCQALGLRTDAYTAVDNEGLDVPIIVAQVPNHVGDTTVLVPDQGASTETQLTTKDASGAVSLLLTDLRETHVDCARYQFLTL
jgi:hypothetical protein